MELNQAPQNAKCNHPHHLRNQSYPHGWFCAGCCRYFFGLVSDDPPQIIPSEWRGLATTHNARKAQVAADMLAKGQTPPTITR